MFTKKLDEKKMDTDKEKVKRPYKRDFVMILRL